MNDSVQPNEARGEDPVELSVGFWLRVLAIAVCAGLAGAALMYLLRLTQHTAFHYREGHFYEHVVATSLGRRVLVLTIAGVLMALVGRFKNAIVGHGGGLQQSIWFHDGHMAFVPTMVRAASSIVGIGMGISLGREGALKQAGAAFASLFSGRGLKGPERRLLAACGAAAGIAAAYNVPVGGALFGMEVLLGALSVELAIPMFASTAIAAAISRKLIHGGPLYEIPSYAPGLAHVVWAALAGPLCGVVAAVYVHWIAWIDAKKPERAWASAAAPLAMCLLLAGLSFVLPQVLGNGRDVVHAALIGNVSMALLVALFLVKPLVTGLCLGSGIPGGLFTPTCCVGALTGELLGRGLIALWPAAPDGSFALLGLAAVLAGATHGPISAVVLVAELTSNTRLVLPALIAAAASTLVARTLSPRSLYSARVHMAMAEAMRHQARNAISSAARYAVVVTQLLTLRGDEVLTVIDEKGRTMGHIDPARVQERQRTLRPRVNIIAADLVVDRGEGD